jgi:hypothetical protein
MAVTDLLLVTNESSAPVYPGNRLVVLEKIVDFAAKTLPAGDSAQVIKVPTDFWVIGALVEVIKAEGGTSTIDIGLTGGNVDEYIDGADLDGAVRSFRLSSDATATPVDMSNGGKHLSAEEIISILSVTGTQAVAKFRLQVFGVDMRPIQNS